jgi:hypothetical protein
MDIHQKFKLIEQHYKKIDEEVRHKHGRPFFNTPQGIWGASSMLDTFELFLRMNFDNKKGIVDLGSGDGRVILIAALFTKSLGIEGDASLHKLALEAKKALITQIPELQRCELLHSDYTKENLLEYDILYTFCDHPWSDDFENALSSSWSGVLLSYNNIFLPKRLKKGKTYWIQQLPIVSYHINIEEENIFLRL